MTTAGPILEAKPHPRRRWRRILLLLTGLFLFYVAGGVVRDRYGILIVLRNDSGAPLHDVSIKVEFRGGRHSIPELMPGEVWRVFVEPVGESHINLTFKDEKNAARDTMLIGYVEASFLGSIRATVTTGPAVQVVDNTLLPFYWKSWLEFF